MIFFDFLPRSKKFDNAAGDRFLIDNVKTMLMCFCYIFIYNENIVGFIVFLYRNFF